MHASKFFMQKVIEFIFHIYAPNTCSLHFRIQVSYGFSMFISLAEQEFKTQQPQLVGDSRGVTIRNYKEPAKKITRRRKDDTNTKKKTIVSNAMIHVKFSCLPLAIPSSAACSSFCVPHQMLSHPILFHCVPARFT